MSFIFGEIHLDCVIGVCFFGACCEIDVYRNRILGYTLKSYFLHPPFFLGSFLLDGFFGIC